MTAVSDAFTHSDARRDDVEMESVLFERCPVVVRGGGDLASGVIYKLHRAGFPVMVTELSTPKLVRRAASYGEAVYSGRVVVDNVMAALAEGRTPQEHFVPVYVNYDVARIKRELKPIVIVDARMDKHNADTSINDAIFVVALGPGYTAGVDCHAVVETKRGHYLGKVIESGSSEADTGEPDAVQGITYERVLRAPVNGHVIPEIIAVDGIIRPIRIGDVLEKGQVIAHINKQPLLAPFKGVVRGLIHESVPVTAGMKIGDIDPRSNSAYCFTISDKARAIGGGVLEAILAAAFVHPYLTR
jgi:xanthine dehydrogenase accessory factor